MTMEQTQGKIGVKEQDNDRVTVVHSTPSVLPSFKPGVEPRATLLGTMPRSGTWYNHLFFGAYSQLLLGKQHFDWPSGVFTNKQLGVDLLVIGHSTCPGFDHYRGQYRQRWEELSFYVPGFYAIPLLIGEEDFQLFNPYTNKNARIIYVYRNPLDWGVSFFQHSQGHLESSLRYYMDEEGIKHDIKDVTEFLFTVGLMAYMKQYWTFRAVSQDHPHTILFVTYECLVRHPVSTFAQMLEFMGHDAQCVPDYEKIKKALQYSSMESVRNIEERMGHALANDQFGKNKSHIKDGAIGKWKTHLHTQDLYEVERRLADFGISLDEFDLE